MNTKKIFAYLIFLVAIFFLYIFVWDFKVNYVDNVKVERDKLADAYTQATQQLSLKGLRLKRQQLGEREISFLQNFIPQSLHTGYFVYNLGQLANLNRLGIRSLQYTVLGQNDQLNNPGGERKLMVEMTVDGNYDDFMTWLKKVETSDVLIDFESIRGNKNSNTSNVISFYVKLYAYGNTID